MTWHGKVEPSAEGAQPAVTNPRAPMVTVAADRLATSHVRGRRNRAEAQRRPLSASLMALPSGGHAIADIGRRSKSP
ncbi:MAG: hypothetical protein WA973_21450 [Mesorhizobium sp.]